MIVDPQMLPKFLNNYWTTMKSPKKKEQALIYKEEFLLPEAIDWFQFIAKLGPWVRPYTILVATCKAVGYQRPCADVWKYVPVQAMVLNLHPIGVWNCSNVSKMDRIVDGSGKKPKNEEVKKWASAIWYSCLVQFLLPFLITERFHDFDHFFDVIGYDFRTLSEQTFKVLTSKVVSQGPPPEEMILDTLQGF